MTTKDQLRLIIENLSEEDAARLLAELETHEATSPSDRGGLRLVGSIAAEPDLSTRYKEIRQAEFGR